MSIPEKKKKKVLKLQGNKVSPIIYLFISKVKQIFAERKYSFH